MNNIFYDPNSNPNPSSSSSLNSNVNASTSTSKASTDINTHPLGSPSFNSSATTSSSFASASVSASAATPNRPTPPKRLRPKLSIGTDGLRPTALSKNITIVTDPSPVVAEPLPKPTGSTATHALSGKPTSTTGSNPNLDTGLNLNSGTSPYPESCSNATVSGDRSSNSRSGSGIGSGSRRHHTQNFTHTHTHIQSQQPSSHRTVHSPQESRANSSSLPKPNSARQSSVTPTHRSHTYPRSASPSLLTHLNSSSDSSPSSPLGGPNSGSDTDDISGEDDILENFEKLERLRLNVANNLRLRPLRQEQELENLTLRGTNGEGGEKSQRNSMTMDMAMTMAMDITGMSMTTTGISATTSTDTIKDMNPNPNSRLRSTRNENYTKTDEIDDLDRKDDDDDIFWSPYTSTLPSSTVTVANTHYSSHSSSYPHSQPHDRMYGSRSSLKSVPDTDSGLGRPDLGRSLTMPDSKRLIEVNTRKGNIPEPGMVDIQSEMGKDMNIESPVPSPALSVYYTPTTELRSSPLSAVYVGVGDRGELSDSDSSKDNDYDYDNDAILYGSCGAGSEEDTDAEGADGRKGLDTLLARTPISQSGRELFRNRPSNKASVYHTSPLVVSACPEGECNTTNAKSSSSHPREQTEADGHITKPSIGLNLSPSLEIPRGMDVDELLAQLDARLPRPLIIDTRPCVDYLACRIRGSVNISIPSLILRRSLHTKPGTAPGSGSGVGASSSGAGLMSFDGLRSYVTTDAGRRVWDAMVRNGSDESGSGSGRGVEWDKTVVVCDEVMDDEETEVEKRGGPNMAICWAVYALLGKVAESHVESGRGGHSHSHGHRDHDNSHSHREVLPEAVAVRAVRFLKGGIAAVRVHACADQVLRAGEEQERRSEEDGTGLVRNFNNNPNINSNTGLFQIDTRSSSASFSLSSAKHLVSTASSASTTSSSPPSKSPSSIPQNLETLSLAAIKDSSSSNNNNNNMLCDMSPSPSPSALAFPPQFSKTRKGSIPNLRRIDTSSAERLVPKLTVRTVPIKANTLAAPSSHSQPATISRHSSASSLRSTHSPPRLNLNLVPPSSNNSSSAAAGPSLSSSTTKNGLSPPSSNNSSTECLLSPSIHHQSSSSSLFYKYSTAAPRTPTTPVGFGLSGSGLGMPSTPSTARPDYDQPPSTEEDPLPIFSISTILPNFLYLGPEPSSPEHVEELSALGVKRILNIAIECDDDLGLGLKERFEKYTRIPMRDTVEEENVARSVREACDALDDARLHSAPTYVHCKAGKSRSVTAVIAYLIHANHWTLARAYAFVTERRKGVSPNIGFVSELMTFEEMELGGKSVGVVGIGGAGARGGANASAAGRGEGSGGSSGPGKGVGGYGAGPASAVEGSSSMDSRQALYNVHQHYGGGYGYGYNGYNASVRRAAKANMRESLPPMVSSSSSSAVLTTGSAMGEEGQDEEGFRMSGGEAGSLSSADASSHSIYPTSTTKSNGLSHSTNAPAPSSARPGLRLEERERVGDSAQEVEVKDASGRYRHARRAPVDEYTLQPMRRVSKAGLESSEWSLGLGSGSERDG